MRQLRVCDTNCVKTLKTWSLSYHESTPNLALSGEVALAVFQFTILAMFFFPVPIAPVSSPQ